MLSYVQSHTVPITIGVSFFVFGFFVFANVLNLSDRDVLIGLIAGAICGVTMLTVSSTQARKSQGTSPRIA